MAGDPDEEQQTPWRDRETPPFGDRVVSWQVAEAELYPQPNEDHDPPPPQSDQDLAEMQRLRGLIMVQASEIEAVLGVILGKLDPNAKVEIPAGALLKAVEKLLSATAQQSWAKELAVIRAAIQRRNRAVHDRVSIGYNWDFIAPGVGEWVAVVSVLGNDAYDECDLLTDLALQQTAMVDAIHLLYSLDAQSQGQDRDDQT